MLPSNMVLGCVTLSVFHLMLCFGLPAVRVLFHVLNCPADNAFPASGHLQLPACNLAGVENCHPAHHKMPGTC